MNKSQQQDNSLIGDCRDILRQQYGHILHNSNTLHFCQFPIYNEIHRKINKHTETSI